TRTGPSPPVSSYSIVPADSSISFMPVRLRAQNPRQRGRGDPLPSRAGGAAGRTVRPRQPARDRPGTAGSARRAAAPAHRGGRGRRGGGGGRKGGPGPGRRPGRVGGTAPGPKGGRAGRSRGPVPSGRRPPAASPGRSYRG